MLYKIWLILLSLLLLTSCTDEKVLLNECTELISDNMKDPDSVTILDYNTNEEYWFKTVYWDYKATNSYWAYIKSYFFCYKNDNEMNLKLSESPINKLTQWISNEEINELMKKSK